MMNKGTKKDLKILGIFCAATLASAVISVALSAPFYIAVIIGFVFSSAALMFGFIKWEILEDEDFPYNPGDRDV